MKSESKKQTVILLVAASEKPVEGYNLGSSMGRVYYVLEQAVYAKTLVAEHFCRAMVNGYERTMIAADPLYPGVGTTDVASEEEVAALNLQHPTRDFGTQVALLTGRFEGEVGVCVLDKDVDMKQVVENICHFYGFKSTREPLVDNEPDGIVKLVFEQNDGFEDKSVELTRVHVQYFLKSFSQIIS